MKIHGPAFDDEGKATGPLVEREILPSELAAYAAVGYKEGGLAPELKEGEAAQKKGKLPEDFPGYTALEAEGLTTYAKVRKQLDAITDVPGIGDATAEKIREALGESAEDEEDSE
jgi:hypothetical protein